MKKFDQLKAEIQKAPSTFLVTGVAGFIGSHLLEQLLLLGQNVVGIDNFATGNQKNLDIVKKIVGSNFSKFTFIKADIVNLEESKKAFEKNPIDYVLHQAALGSVPRSIDDPLDSHRSNVDGFVNLLLLARDFKVKKFVYASSSSVYGDSQLSPKREGEIGEALSPYAVTKRTNELYAAVFSKTYNMNVVGLRYFNVFGPRQNPEGPYAAVIPRWIDSLLRAEPATIFGDGSTSRDFCFVQNVVQANLLSAVIDTKGSEVFNVAAGKETSLLELYKMIQQQLASKKPELQKLATPVFQPFRQGDIKRSLADISKIQTALGYSPTHSVEAGITELVQKVLET